MGRILNQQPVRLGVQAGTGGTRDVLTPVTNVRLIKWALVPVVPVVPVFYEAVL